MHACGCRNLYQIHTLTVLPSMEYLHLLLPIEFFSSQQFDQFCDFCPCTPRHMCLNASNQHKTECALVDGINFTRITRTSTYLHQFFRFSENLPFYRVFLLRRTQQRDSGRNQNPFRYVTRPPIRISEVKRRFVFLLVNGGRRNAVASILQTDRCN